MAAEGDSDQPRELEARRLAAVIAGNANVLDALHAAGFVLCTPSGDVWSRRHYLGGLIDGTINYLRSEPVTPIEVISDTDLAVLRYGSEIEISIGGGALGHLACWHLDVYQREGTSWRCRWSQATDTIPGQISDDKPHQPPSDPSGPARFPRTNPSAGRVPRSSERPVC